ALAAIKVDVLAGWNLKHIINLRRIKGYNSVNLPLTVNLQLNTQQQIKTGSNSSTNYRPGYWNPRIFPVGPVFAFNRKYRMHDPWAKVARRIDGISRSASKR